MNDNPMLQTLEQHRDLILLAEVGALVHDLGKLSKEFITEPGEAHSQILRRFADLSDPRFPSVNSIRDAALTWIGNDLPKVPSELDRTVLNGLITQMRMSIFPDAFAFARTFLSSVSGKISSRVFKFLTDRYLASITGEESINLSDSEFVPSQLRDLLNDMTLADWLQHSAFSVQLKTFGDFIALHHGTYVDPRPQAVQLLRAGDGGTDGFDSWIDKGQVDQRGSQLLARTLIATAFGHEAQRLPVGPAEDGLKAVRHRFAEVLTDALSKVRDGQATPTQVRCRIFGEAETAFRQALGETRRAANDVTLWDHCYSTASLYKAALTKVLLEKALDEEYEFPQPSTIGWRFLQVCVDGMSFFAQAHHVTDILGRRQALMEALNAVQQALEVKYPLGNEVYRDENGSIFVMPGLADENAHEKLAQEVKPLVLKTFRQAGLGEELVPEVVWNDGGPVREEMITAFGQMVAQPPRPPSPDPQAVRQWWEEPQAEHKEICTVCGVRPIGYDVPKLYGPGEKRIAYYLEAADERKVCGPCLKRREGRSEVWATNADGSFTRTIWIDEVADNNGRFALVVGRFDLGGWLDGKLVSTMLVAPGIEKNASPARIRRCWDTTRQFWLDLVESHDGKPPELKEVITRRPFRLRINPANADKVNEALGDYHVYDWPLGGGITMSVVWVPDDEVGGHFLTADNLWYLVGPEQLDRVKREELGDNARVLTELGRLINRQEEVRLEEPSGYGRPAEARVIVERPEVKPVCEAYTPYIPILTEPATFMALVPADSALEVTKAIKNKYSTEMGRVHDRLPLHLGLVFAPRHTPLSAVLEAGRAMLNMPTTWEEWQIATIGHKATFSRNGRTFEWEYPAQMGDEQTQDIWYPHLLVVDPTVKPDLSLKAGSFRPVDNLTDTVYIRPSRFDFVFLDTTARCFEIAYQTSEIFRASHHPRPFLLNDLDRLEKLWEELCQLEKSQRHQVIASIEATRESWFGDDGQGESLTDGVFRQFVRDTLAGAAWPNERTWQAICKDKKDKDLENAGVTGELADLAELHTQILKE